MPLIHDIFTASNVAGYYQATQESTDSTLGERLFPARKQLGLTLTQVKGGGGKSVVLKASEFDTPATMRDRMSIELDTEKMPFFKEGMLIKETDRQQLNTLSQTGNQNLINTVTNVIFNDKVTLLNGAHARLEAMRMRVLATGVLDIISDGVAHNYDYAVPEANKGEVTTSWADAGADPFADIETAVEAMEELGHKPEVIIMNKNTFNLIRNAEATIGYINPDGAKPTRNQVLDYLDTELELQVEFKNDTFKDEDGIVKKFYPDGHITLVPNEILGNTVFGTTPEESDLMSGANVDVQIVDTGIAVTTTASNDPVNVTTKVTMIALPSFENLESVYMLEVVPGV